MSPRAAQGALPREKRDTKPSPGAPVPPEHPGIHPGRSPRAGEERNFGIFFFYSREAQAEKVLGWDGEGWERMGTSGRDGERRGCPIQQPPEAINGLFVIAAKAAGGKMRTERLEGGQ